jgi:hypothetical protein
MPPTSNEARVLLALEALENDKKLSLRAVAKVYNVYYTTLSRQRASRPARRDITPNSRRLTDSEEEAIVQYIVELVTRSFPLRLRGIEDIAN